MIPLAKVTSSKFTSLHILHTLLPTGSSNHIDQGRYDEYYEDDYSDQGSYEYDDEYSPSSQRNGIPILDQFMELIRNQRQLGASLIGLGAMLTFAGMMLFFDPTLLRFGNICMLAGIPLLLGPDTVRQYFLRRERLQASLIIGLGILLVFFGKPRMGILLEIFGLLNTVGNMNPFVVGMFKKLPIIGDVFSAFEKKPSQNNYNHQSSRGRARMPPRTPKRYNPSF